MRLERSFFQRDTLTVARDLLGHTLVRVSEEGTVKGMIVETEAYLGPRDDAAHSYKKKSSRVQVQYGPAGCAYIYLIYGMYHCLNITTGPEGDPEVVLLRALEPLSGLPLISGRRRTEKPTQLMNGPGKLCQALDIGMGLYGEDICISDQLYMEQGSQPVMVESSKRIGIDYALLTRDMPWRFSVAGNAFVSKSPKIGK